MSIILIYKQGIKKEYFDEYLGLLKDLLPPCRLEPGCISLKLCQDANNPYVLTEVQEWETMQHLIDHSNTPGSEENHKIMEKMVADELMEVELLEVIL